MATNTKQLSQIQESNGLSLSSVFEALSKEGFRPEVDDDDDIKFKCEGRVYFISLYEDDADFVRVSAINIAPELQDMDTALRCCNAVSRDIKVAKAFCVDREGIPRVWVTAECRYKDTAEFMNQVIHLIGGIRAGVNHFREVLNEEKRPISDEDKPDLGLLN